MKILQTYLEYYGYQVPKDNESKAPLLTFLLADCVQYLHTTHIQPLKFKNQLKLYSKRLMDSWHNHNQHLMRALTNEQKSILIDCMDDFSVFLEEDMVELKNAVQEALHEFPQNIQETAAYLTLIVHFAACSWISWRDIYRGVENRNVKGMASNAENLFKAYTRAFAHTEKILDLNEFAPIREASTSLCNRFLDYIQNRIEL